ncbi:MAG: hypothetical protein WC897_01345 [Candidatus Gracilibacteria bacterium]
MKQMLNKIIAGLIKHKKVVLPLIFVYVLFMPCMTHAADDSVEKTVLGVVSLVIQVLDMLLWPVLLMLGDLMDTQLILGPGMEEKLMTIWIQMRNLVNIAFVLVLLFVALYNVIGLGGEGELAIKTILPRIIIGLVLVNFTLVIGKLALDGVNLGTTIAFSLPEYTEGYSFAETREAFFTKVCLKSDGKTPYTETTAATAAQKDAIPMSTRMFCQRNSTTGAYDELDPTIEMRYFQSLNKNNIGLVMAVNMGGLSSLGILKTDAINSWTTMTVSFIFSLVLHLVYAISFLVLGIVLITRIMVIWLALALSPLAVFLYVVPQAKEWLGGGGGDITKKVVKHLISPMIIGLVMSMGFIMTSAWGTVASLSINNTKISEIMGANFLVSGIDDLPQLIIAMATVVIIWLGIFAAASDTYAGGITNSIKGFGERIGEAALKAPLYLPTLTVGSRGGEPVKASMMLALNAADTGLRSLESGQKTVEELREMGEHLGTNDPIFKLFGGAGEPHPSRQSAETNAAEIASMFSADLPQLTAKQAETLLERLKVTVGASELSKADQETRIKEIERVRKIYASGDKHDMKALQALVNKYEGEGADGWGLKNNQYKALRKVDVATIIVEVPKPPTPAPTPAPATGAPPPAGGAVAPPAGAPPAGAPPVATPAVAPPAGAPPAGAPPAGAPPAGAPPVATPAVATPPVGTP